MVTVTISCRFRVQRLRVLWTVAMTVTHWPMEIRRLSASDPATASMGCVALTVRTARIGTVFERSMYRLG